MVGEGARPGRIETGIVTLPVAVGGVLIRPGDMIVADGDGVVVVLREHAERVAEIGWVIAAGEKEGRKRLYDRVGLKPDSTLEQKR